MTELSCVIVCVCVLCVHVRVQGSSVLFDASEFTPLDPTQEPIFPPALRVRLYIPL